MKSAIIDDAVRAGMSREQAMDRTESTDRRERPTTDGQRAAIRDSIISHATPAVN